ncbi:endonuclease III [Cryptosporidium ryanae]|uniref:endonuclease III n=1 Tax=Cryptosporidium ryanae TaxID=515981 RepID=UPI00351A8D4F|nr:endonuclease III [Cryptosporidium ryanae]
MSLSSDKRKRKNSSDCSGLENFDTIWGGNVEDLFKHKFSLTVISMREKGDAPVDEFGCESFVNKTLPDDEWRFHVLVAAFLSSQTKDQVTYSCMNRLIEYGLTPESINKIKIESLRELLYGVGFYNTKAKNLKEISRILLEHYSGVVPDKYEQLIRLPGIGPKMANLILQTGFGMVVGISVDTHMHRIFNRIGWVNTKTPVETGKAMEKRLPREYWNKINRVFVGFGQTICKPIGPKIGRLPFSMKKVQLTKMFKCSECAIADYCSFSSKQIRKNRDSKTKMSYEGENEEELQQF